MRRQSSSRLRNGFEATMSPEFEHWRPPKGVRRPNRREMMRAMESIPARMDWEWASSRIVPVLERPGSDPQPDDPQLAASADCGISYGFGIEIGPAFARVTRSMARGWDREPRQVQEVALANLRRRTRDENIAIEASAGDDVAVRALTKPDGCASSLLLVPDALRRLFGEENQIFTAPMRSLLLSFPAEMPDEEVDEMTMHFEQLDPHPLHLDPFRLIAGRLTWDGIVPPIRRR